MRPASWGGREILERFDDDRMNLPSNSYFDSYFELKSGKDIAAPTITSAQTRRSKKLPRNHEEIAKTLAIKPRNSFTNRRTKVLRSTSHILQPLDPGLSAIPESTPLFLNSAASLPPPTNGHLTLTSLPFSTHVLFSTISWTISSLSLSGSRYAPFLVSLGSIYFFFAVLFWYLGDPDEVMLRGYRDHHIVPRRTY